MKRTKTYILAVFLFASVVTFLTLREVQLRRSDDPLLGLPVRTEISSEKPTDYPIVMSQKVQMKPSGMEIVETDFSNMEATTEYEEYTSDSSVINCLVINNNLNRGFWLFQFPLIEFQEKKGGWRRLCYYPPGIGEEASWVFLVNHEGEKSKDILKFYPQYLLHDELIPGNYRLVIQIEKDILFAPFTVVESDRQQPVESRQKRF